MIRCLRDGIITPPFNTVPTNEPLVPVPRTCGDGEYGDVPQALFVESPSWYVWACGYIITSGVRMFALRTVVTHVLFDRLFAVIFIMYRCTCREDQTAQSPSGNIGNRRSHRLMTSSPPPSSTKAISDDSMIGASLSLWNQSLAEHSDMISPSRSYPDSATATASAAAEDGRQWLQWRPDIYPDEFDLGVFSSPRKGNATAAAMESSPLSSPGFLQPKPGASSWYGQMLREDREEASSRYLELSTNSSPASSSRSATDTHQDITASRHSTGIRRTFTLPTNENNDKKTFHVELPLKHDSRAEGKAPAANQFNFSNDGRTAGLNEQNMLRPNTMKNTWEMQTSFPSYSLEPAKESPQTSITSHMLSPSGKGDEDRAKTLKSYMELANGTISSSMKASSAPTDFKIQAYARNGRSDRLTTYRSPNKEETSQSYLELTEGSSLASSSRSAIDAEDITATRRTDLSSFSRTITLPTKEDNHDDEKTFRSYVELPLKHYSRAEDIKAPADSQFSFSNDGRTTDLAEQNMLPPNTIMMQTSYPRYGPMEPAKESKQTSNTSHMLSPSGKDDRRDLEKTFKSCMELLANDTVSNSMKASSAAPTDFKFLADARSISHTSDHRLNAYRSPNKEKSSQSYLEPATAGSWISSTSTAPVDSQISTQQGNLDKAFQNCQELANGFMGRMTASSSSTPDSLIGAANYRRNNNIISTYRLTDTTEKMTLSSYLELPTSIIPPDASSKQMKFDYRRPLVDGSPSGGPIMSFCGAFRDGAQARAAAAGVV